MGFLKFLKREKKKDEFEELDLPPAPPPLEGFEESTELPELPDFPEFEEKISATKEEELPKFDFPEETMPGMEKDIPKFPSFELEETEAQQQSVAPTPIPPITAPKVEPMPTEPVPVLAPKEEIKESGEAFPKFERRLFSHEKRVLRERPSAKIIYVKVDRFKATLGNINMVRSDLRKSEEGLTKLENIKNAKDKSFDKVRASLDDLQKKLIFVDKTLFKEE